MKFPYMTALRLHNTLTQETQEFAPERNNTVRMYTCGPTVYDFAHIGNFRTFTFVDILRKTLRANGYKLDHVMNITDVDDKIIRNAAAKGTTIQEYTAAFTQAFLDDCKALRLERAERLTPATEHIGEMAEAISRLTESSHTYVREGSVYFRIASFPEYGKLSHSDFSGNMAGARVDVDEYEKADARDFALWKAPKPGEHYWDTSVGPGRPGWHIECSAMALKYLGDTIDIHAGGVDLIFPHHENEIAQSESITGKQFARFWLHAEFLMVEGQKMSKSLGNYFTLRDILARGYEPESVRYLLASTPYRKSLNFTFDGLKAAASAIERLRNFKLRLKTDRSPDGANGELTARAAAATEAFMAGMNDDLNTAEALGAVFEYVRDANLAMDAGRFQADNAKEALEFLARVDSIFDVLRPTVAAGAIEDAEVDALISERTAARKAKEFARSDKIRDELLARGIVLEDTKAGVRWKRK